MSDYEIGKNIERLRNRVAWLEEQVEDLMEFSVDCEGDAQDAAEMVEMVPDVAMEGGEIGDAAVAAASAAKFIRLTFGTSTCHAMQHKGSWLRIWENGSWQSHCTLKDRSRHSKWGNSVDFYVASDSGKKLFSISDLIAWQGNFSPGEEKSYSGRGSSSKLQSRFQEISQGKLTVVRQWRCWRR
ncbi:MAG: hypothetical protein KDI55_13230 [Anaerolineae bacterium]|nr:hypothetical protein [Anaerolineae bacterium]